MAEPRTCREHPLARAFALNDRQTVERLLTEGWCGPNDSYVCHFGEEIRRRTPLQLALSVARTPCFRNAQLCSHIDCLLASPDSMLRLVISLGADFNHNNYLIDYVLFYSPFRPFPPLLSEDSDELGNLQRDMLAWGCTEENFRALRFFYAKDQHLMLDFVQSCIEHGLRRDSRGPRTIIVSRTLALLAAMWPGVWDAPRLLTLQINLWLCGFDLAHPVGDMPRVRTFHLLPSSLKRNIVIVMEEAIAFACEPLSLAFLARSAIRSAVQLANFKSSISRLKLPTSLRNFVLFAH